MHRIALRSGCWTALATLALLAPLPAGGPAAAARSGGDAVAPPDVERRIAALLRDWFALLEDRPPGSAWSEELRVEPTLEISVAKGEARAHAEAEAWLDDLRSPHPRVEFRLGALRIDAGGPDLYRARFELDRSAWDAAGTLHVARWEHTWLVRSVAGEPLAILGIEERPSLAFPGTGPRIICN